MRDALGSDAVEAALTDNAGIYATVGGQLNTAEAGSGNGLAAR